MYHLNMAWFMQKICYCYLHLYMDDETILYLANYAENNEPLQHIDSEEITELCHAKEENALLTKFVNYGQ